MRGRQWPSVGAGELEHGVPLSLTQLAETLRLESTGTPFPEGAMDMDTPSDYARLRESHRELSTHITV